jgi:glutathione S-transferase
MDNNQTPAFPIIETSAQLLYLQQTYDKDNRFGFANALEQSEAVQWLFFWHGSGAPYQGNLGFFRRAEEQSPCE